MVAAANNILDAPHKVAGPPARLFDSQRSSARHEQLSAEDREHLHSRIHMLFPSLLRR